MNESKRSFVHAEVGIACMICGKDASIVSRFPEAPWNLAVEVVFDGMVYEDWMNCFECDVDTFHPIKEPALSTNPLEK